jgi:hypothetical protein
MSWQEKYENMFDEPMPEPEGYHDLVSSFVRMEQLAKKSVEKRIPLSQETVNQFFGFQQAMAGKKVMY